MEAFLDISTLLFATSIWIVVYLIRSVVEGSLRVSRENRIWKGVLVCMPPIFGLVFAIILPSFSFPAAIKGQADKAMYGICCGFFSSWFYKLVRDTLKKKVVDAKDALEKSELCPAQMGCCFS